MNTLRLSSHIPEAWVMPRFGAFFGTLLDIFAEAHAMAVAAEKTRFMTER
jgi:hypothetical protein